MLAVSNRSTKFEINLLIANKLVCVSKGGPKQRLLATRAALTSRMCLRVENRYVRNVAIQSRSSSTANAQKQIAFNCMQSNLSPKGSRGCAVPAHVLKTNDVDLAQTQTLYAEDLADA